MKKIIPLIFIWCFGVFNALGQTTASNFTAVDCDMVSHTLFDDLDSGKIVVMVWVMPCSSCSAGAKTAYGEVQKFVSSHPKKVVMYLADDFGNTNCATLKNWSNSISVSNVNTFYFQNANTVMDEEKFGGTGMPHVTVIGSDHKIYFNKLNNQANDASGINAAISTALGVSSTNEVLIDKFSLMVLPNPINEKFEIGFTTLKNSMVGIQLFDLQGKLIFEKPASMFNANNHKIELDGSNLETGNYFLQLNIDNSSIYKKVLVY